MKFRHTFRVNAKQDAVDSFHQDPRVLRSITPFPIMIHFHHVEPIVEGSSVDFTLWFGPIPVRWVAKHSHVGLDNGFVDEQIRGPFKRWVHQHVFEPITAQTTEVIDEIEADLRGHPWWLLVGVMMWITLPILFSYRAWKTKRLIEGAQKVS